MHMFLVDQGGQLARPFKLGEVHMSKIGDPAWECLPLLSQRFPEACHPP